MKLISLNTWGCRVTEPLFDCIKKYSEATDIFCFQEILKGGNGKTKRGEIKNAYEEICRILPNHTGYFSEYGEDGYYSEDSKDLDFKFGIAIFSRSSLKQHFSGDIILRDGEIKWRDYSGRFSGGVALAITVDDYSIVNVHGLWQNSIKTDTEAKIEQSKKIIDFSGRIPGKKIICGDFNLLPNTKSIQMLDDCYKDLNINKEYDIKETRSSLYPKDLRYSDYIFTDKAITTNNFSVPNLVVSDHLVLSLDFSYRAVGPLVTVSII